MLQYLERINRELVGADLSNFWPGFKMVAFALFDDEQVYVYNHPKFNVSPYKLKRNEQFNGCTLILFEEYPTAIVDVTLYDDYESIFSLLVHELFHGYQYLRGEKRFPDELLGITYPISKENVQLRNEERIHLYHALVETNKEKRQSCINRFIAIRETRATLIDEHLVYEQLMETIEGPAWYVEVKAYTEKSKQDSREVIMKYGQSLIDKYDSNAQIRRSCYSSGLFMCLLLDELSPGWKDDYLEKDETLYEMFKRFSSEEVSIGSVEITEETEDIVQFALEEKEKEFKIFDDKEKIHLIIEGVIEVKGFDPMNMIALNDKILHKHFLKVRMGERNYLLQQPVIAYGGLRNIAKLHLMFKNEPDVKGNSLLIEGVGEIKGMIHRELNTILVYL